MLANLLGLQSCLDRLFGDRWLACCPIESGATTERELAPLAPFPQQATDLGAHPCAESG